MEDLSIKGRGSAENSNGRLSPTQVSSRSPESEFQVFQQNLSSVLPIRMDCELTQKLVGPEPVVVPDSGLHTEQWGGLAQSSAHLQYSASQLRSLDRRVHKTLVPSKQYIRFSERKYYKVSLESLSYLGWLVLANVLVRLLERSLQQELYSTKDKRQSGVYRV